MTEPSSSIKPAITEPLLPPGWDVPQVFRDRLGDDAGRQRLMQHDGHLLLVLHAPPLAEEARRRGRLFWRDPEGVWKPQGLKHDELALGELIGEYEARAAELDDAEDAADEAREYFDLLTSLAPLVRAAHNLYSVVQEARQAAGADRRLINLRDRAYAVTRRLELLQQDAKNTLDFVIARRAEEQADSSRRQARAAYRLNVLAALFFPLATVTTLLSTNLGHGAALDRLDAAQAPAPLLMLLAGGLVLGAVLAVFIARK